MTIFNIARDFVESLKPRPRFQHSTGQAYKGKKLRLEVTSKSMLGEEDEYCGFIYAKTHFLVCNKSWGGGKIQGHIISLIPRRSSQTLAGQDVANPSIIPICIMNQYTVDEGWI